jgi:hypothetical protein
MLASALLTVSAVLAPGPSLSATTTTSADLTQSQLTAAPDAIEEDSHCSPTFIRSLRADPNPCSSWNGTPRLEP